MSYQKLFNNYFSTYGSQTGGAAVPAPMKTAGQGLAAPQQQFTQEQFNVFLQERGMDNSPVLKPQTAIVPLTREVIIAKSKGSNWRKTPVRSGNEKFSQLSKNKIIAQSGLSPASQPSLMAMKSKATQQQQPDVFQQQQMRGNQELIQKANKKPGRTLKEMESLQNQKLAANTGKPQRTLKEMSGQ